jgi:putative glutamine amidotransferase
MPVEVVIDALLSKRVNVSKIYENAKYPNNTIARIFFRKEINVEYGSLLEKLLNTHRIAVNSMHTQAVDKIGNGLVVSAKEDNGVIQGIEDPEKDFFIGVQFHPEALVHLRIFRNMFSALNQAALRNQSS